MLAGAHDANSAAYICAEILVHMYALEPTYDQCMCRHGGPACFRYVY